MFFCTFCFSHQSCKGGNIVQLWQIRRRRLRGSPGVTEVAKGSSLLVPKRVLVPHLRFHCTTWFRTVQDGGMGCVSVVGHRPLRTGPGGTSWAWRSHIWEQGTHMKRLPTPLLGAPDQSLEETGMSSCLFSHMSPCALLTIARRVQTPAYALRAAILHAGRTLEPIGSHTTRTVLDRGVAPVLFQCSLDDTNIQPRLGTGVLNSRFMWETPRT